MNAENYSTFCDKRKIYSQNFLKIIFEEKINTRVI